MQNFYEWLENKKLWIDLYFHLSEADDMRPDKGVYKDENYHNDLIKKLRILGLGEDANELEMIKISQDDIDYSNSNLNYSDFPSNAKAFNKRLEEYKNGRVILYAGDNYKPYETYQGSSEPQKCFTDSVSHIHTATPLTQSYFSRENVDLVQNEIIKRIYNQIGYVISRQSDTNLQIIMRSIYLQYGKNLPCQIKEQVLELNEEVYKECLRIIIPNTIIHQILIMEVLVIFTVLLHLQIMHSQNQINLIQIINQIIF
jgi:hypothetical protein